MRMGLVVAGAITVVGMLGLAIAVILGFEEAPAGLFLLSALMFLAGPVFLLGDFVVTKSLSKDEKRVWMRRFLSRRPLQAASAYLAHITSAPEAARQRR